MSDTPRCDALWAKPGRDDRTADFATLACQIERELDSLYVATNDLMAVLGYHGTVSARDDRVQVVMDALAQIDAAAIRALNSK